MDAIVFLPLTALATMYFARRVSAPLSVVLGLLLSVFSVDWPFHFQQLSAILTMAALVPLSAGLVLVWRVPT